MPAQIKPVSFESTVSEADALHAYMCASAVLFCFQTSYNPNLLEDSISGQMCGDKAAPSVAYPVMAEFVRRVVESMALSVAHCIFVVVVLQIVKGEKWMWSHQRGIFSQRRMKERSGWGHTRDDFFDREKWMQSHHRRFFSQRDS